MKKLPSLWASGLLLVSLWSILALGACGSTPTPTATSVEPPLPAPTLRPTFTPTVLTGAIEKPSPTVEAGTESTRQPAANTPGSPNTRMPEPSPAPPEFTPTPAATRAAGPLPSLSGTLLFPVFDTTRQTYDIYRLELGTGQMEKFIEQGSQPAVTPGGRRVAWRSWKPDQRGLLSRLMDGTDIWQMIAFNEAARPDWAPDGERFVFPGRLEPDRQSRLYLFTGVGEDEPYIEIQRHGSPIIGRTPAFLPDGRIVYQGCVEDACGLYLMDADGTNPQLITEFIDDTTPAVSPDGKKIAYMSKVSGYWQVNVVGADGTDQHHLTDDWYWNGLPVWSPDGKYILFVSTRDENWPDHFSQVDNARSKFRLWIMDANGGNQRPLNDFAFRLDGVPAGVPAGEVGGWIEERLVWMMAATTE
jgi:Tol biopolymer transport system component